MSEADKPLFWLVGKLETPPLSREARVEAGYLLRQLQCGLLLAMPQSRPMPTIGPGCYQLRINDRESTWRIVVALFADAVVVLEVFSKKSRATPRPVIARCRERLRSYVAAAEGGRS